MVRDITLPAIFAGVLAAIVGFASSFAIVVQGLLAAGATPAQAASGLMALSLAMGLCGVLLSLTTRMPVSIAWSTPGAALLASSVALPGGFASAVGGFLVCAALLLLAASWRPLERLVTAIPPAIASAMLAGVLMGLCLAPARAIQVSPLWTAIVAAIWFGVLLVRRIYAVPAAVLAAGAIIVWTMPPGALAGVTLLARPELVAPRFDMATIAGVALPLFLVTMASQNLPASPCCRPMAMRRRPAGCCAQRRCSARLRPPLAAMLSISPPSRPLFAPGRKRAPIPGSAIGQRSHRAPAMS